MFPHLFLRDKGDCTVTFNFAFIPGINVMCILCLFPGDKVLGLSRFGISDPFIPGKQTKDTQHIYPRDKGEVKCDCTVTFIPGKKVEKHVTFIPQFISGIKVSFIPRKQPGIKMIFISAFSAG